MKFKTLIENTHPCKYLVRSNLNNYGSKSFNDKNSQYYGKFYFGISGDKSTINNNSISGNEYGYKRLYKLDPSAKIYYTPARGELIIDHNLLDYPAKIIPRLTNGESNTIRDYMSTYENSMWAKYYYGKENPLQGYEFKHMSRDEQVYEINNTYGFDEGEEHFGVILQDVIAEYLNSIGYDGVCYQRDSYDNEYQIWNNNIVIPVTINNDNETTHSWDDRKLRIGITNCFKNLLNIKELKNYEDLENEILTKLNISLKDFSGMDQSEIDKELNKLIYYGFQKDILFNNNISLKNSLKDNFINFFLHDLNLIKKKPYLKNCNNPVFIDNILKDIPESLYKDWYPVKFTPSFNKDKYAVSFTYDYKDLDNFFAVDQEGKLFDLESKKELSLPEFMQMYNKASNQVIKEYNQYKDMFN